MDIYHTDSLLRKHQLLVLQADKTFSLVDATSYKPVSKSRSRAYFEELEPGHAGEVWCFE